MAAAFHEAYAHEFGNTLGGIPVVVVNLRTSVTGLRKRPAEESRDAVERSVAQPKARRQVFFDGWAETQVFDRTALVPGMAFDGPAIVEQADCTTVVLPGMTGRIDALGNLIVEG